MEKTPQTILYYLDLTSPNTHTHTHLRTALTLTALLKVQLSPCSIICLSQKYTPVSWWLTWQRYNHPFFSQERLLCSDIDLLPCKKAHLSELLLWFICFHCEMDKSHVCTSPCTRWRLCCHYRCDLGRRHSHLYPRVVFHCSPQAGSIPDWCSPPPVDGRTTCCHWTADIRTFNKSSVAHT